MLSFSPFSSFVLSRSFHTKIKLNSPIISHYFAFSPSVLPIDNGTLSIDSIATREKYGRKERKGNNLFSTPRDDVILLKSTKKMENAVKISTKVLLLSFCRFNCSHNVIVTFHWVLITNYYRENSIVIITLSSHFDEQYFLDKFIYDRSS